MFTNCCQGRQVRDASALVRLHQRSLVNIFCSSSSAHHRHTITTCQRSAMLQDDHHALAMSRSGSSMVLWMLIPYRNTPPPYERPSALFSLNVFAGIICLINKGWFGKQSSMLRPDQNPMWELDWMDCHSMRWVE